MQTPFLIIVGEAGSGKDTVAGFLAKNHNYAVIAQADPMKRYVGALFKFSEDQMWGASMYRNGEDPRWPAYNAAWETAHPFHENHCKLTDTFIESIRPYVPERIRTFQIENLLRNWFEDLQKNMVKEKRYLTPRAALQTFGTEFGRNMRPDMWSEIAIDTGWKLLRGGVLYTPQEGLIVSAGFKGFDNVVITDGRFRNEVLNVLKIGGRALRLLNPKDDSEATEKAGIRGHASEAEQKGIPDEWFLYTLVNDKRLGLGILEKRVFALANPVIKVTFNDGLDTESTAAGRPPNCT